MKICFSTRVDVNLGPLPRLFSPKNKDDFSAAILKVPAPCGFQLWLRQAEAAAVAGGAAASLAFQLPCCFHS